MSVGPSDETPPPHSPGADRDSLVTDWIWIGGYMTMFVWDKTRGLQSARVRVMAKGPRRRHNQSASTPSRTESKTRGIMTVVSCFNSKFQS